MTPTRLLLATFALAAAPAFAQAPPLEENLPAGTPARSLSNDPAQLRQQLADALEISNGLRDQIDTTLAERDRLLQEAEVLRQQRDALQARVTGLQRHTQVNEAAPATAEKDAELAKLKAELVAVGVARDNASADARNLARELATTRADRDKYQRNSMEDRAKVDLLHGDLNACLSGR